MPGGGEEGEEIAADAVARVDLKEGFDVWGIAEEGVEGAACESPSPEPPGYADGGDGGAEDDCAFDSTMDYEVCRDEAGYDEEALKFACAGAAEEEAGGDEGVVRVRVD